MEIVLVSLYSDVRRHGLCHDGRRPVQCGRSVAHDPVLRALGGAFHIPGSRYILASNSVSRTVPFLVVTEPKVHRPVFCCRDGLARAVYFHHVELLRRLLLRGSFLSS